MHTARRVWQYKGCDMQTSVTAGPMVMHGTRATAAVSWAA